MGNNVTPVLIDLSKLRSVLGSNDTKLLRAIIKKRRQEVLEIDALGESFDEFEKQIKAEYKALIAGDFSGLPLTAKAPRNRDTSGDEPASEADGNMFQEVLKLDTSDPKAVKQFMAKYGQAVADFFGDGAGDDDSEEDDSEDEPAHKELTTGAALAQLILGGAPDPRYGYKYAYAFHWLCQQLGETPHHDSWCSIRNASLKAVDRVIAKAGGKGKAISASKLLINRGAPVDIPRPDDFPFIGYATRDEAAKFLARLDPAKTRVAIENVKEDQEWLEAAIGELRSWFESCVDTNQDLVCFYF